ncbi:S-adenosyl-L-methionine-dependent methyltransferase [Lasiosphaeris hirsuta]|uniref:S-adenosyl-L-methionine-dependent methyltransferase n=1 Tax=Lasiosphaeris hirsuta TaxID=260670 RepID=A0AA40E1T9_9PEZI|nr:S-adenosyl-L-methionine-dependent methyltransferase [Lasiosphaeris hirsuta]
MTTPPPPSTSSSPAPSLGRLQSTFVDHPFSAHGPQWDLLWREAYTPWDRNGPSLALADLLASQPALFPRPLQGRKALVPGCGRGHDALLLRAFGYVVVGFDFSEASLKAAVENQLKAGREPEYAPREGGGGTVRWVRGDFFEEEQGELVAGGFDLIFDYTFFCALPPEARPKWAKRMSELLNPDGGRLVCLEWPLTKPASTGGPPWGVTVEAYAAHLSHPGEDLTYNENGLVASSVPRTPSPSALEQLGRFKPTRTHEAGCDAEGNVLDFISVWAHPSQPS